MGIYDEFSKEVSISDSATKDIDNFKINNITINDIPEIRKCVSECSPLDMHTPYTYWVIANFFSECSFKISYDNKIVGFITSIKSFNNVFFIWQMGVLTDFRKMGLVQILIDNVVEVIKKQNIYSLYASIDANNIKSKHSFSKYAKNKNYILVKSGELHITDLLIKEFAENENIYELSFPL